MAEQIPFLGGAPFALIELAVEPASRADADRLAEALWTLAGDDPQFGAWADAESGQTILGGVSERQLDRKIELLKQVGGLQINIGAPQVAYRETLGRVTEVDHTHKKQTGGSGQFARVKIRFEPGGSGSGYQFESKVVGGAVPEEFIPGVEKGLASARENGLLAGFPVIDFKATLVDGAYHDVDSSVLAFEIASRAAFRELRDKARPKLLEPVMKVEVMAPDEYAGSVIGDLNRRRGQIQRQEMGGAAVVIGALVPLSNMFGYEPQLSFLTQGSGRFRMAYSHYQPVPQGPDEDDPDFSPAVGMRA